MRPYSGLSKYLSSVPTEANSAAVVVANDSQEDMKEQPRATSPDLSSVTSPTDAGSSSHFSSDDEEWPEPLTPQPLDETPLEGAPSVTSSPESSHGHDEGRPRKRSRGSDDGTDGGFVEDADDGFNQTKDTSAIKDAQVQIQALQVQLATVSQSLSSMLPTVTVVNQNSTSSPPSPGPPPQPFPTYKTNTTHQQSIDNLEVALAASRLQVGNLTRQNELLRKLLDRSKVAEESKSQKIKHLEEFMLPIQAVNGGVDADAITQLANDLICEIKPVDVVASALLDLADRSGTVPPSNGREKLSPLTRLHNMEGVVDVTLERVDALEKENRKIKGFDISCMIDENDTQPQDQDMDV